MRHIIPECYIDTNLAETILGVYGCNHQKGCNQVAKVMQEKFADQFAVGIIDADKRLPGYLTEFVEYGKSNHLSLYKHRSRHHYMIVVSPACDGFILSCAENMNIDVSLYGFSATLRDFIRQTKNIMSSRDERFKRLFRDMTSCGEMKLFNRLLCYLNNCRYNVSKNELNSIFELGA